MIITLGVYITGVVAYIVGGFVEEDVLPALGLNTSGSAEFKKLIQVEDDLFKALQPDVINDIYISLLNDDNAIISQPYEIKVEKLFFGKPIEIDFALLQDLDMLTVNLVYSNGTQRSPKIYLEKDESAGKAGIAGDR